MVSSPSRSIRVAVGLCLCGGLVSAAGAGITCCEVDGKRVCGDPVPPACVSRARTVFDKGGTAKAVAAPLTAEQIAARDAEAARKKEEEKRAAEQARKDSALLDSYTSERDLDAARDRAIADIEKNAEQAKNRLEDAQKKKLKLDQEKEFFQKKPLPPALATQVKNNDDEIAAQQKILGQKDADIAAVRERYAADKERYLKLTGRKSAVRP